MRVMPILETAQLQIRPFVITDLHDLFQHNRAIGWVDEEATPAAQLEEVRQYLAWNSMNHIQLARLGQPPYGDRAVVLKKSGKFVGSCGLVPYTASLHHFPSFGSTPTGQSSAEMGLMWTIHPDYQRQGFATEVAQALIDYAFREMRLNRLIATTGYDNIASQRVMRKVGMHVEENPFREPPWDQVLGIIENRLPEL